MTSKNILSDIDVDGIVKKSLKRSGLINEVKSLYLSFSDENAAWAFLDVATKKGFSDLDSSTPTKKGSVTIVTIPQEYAHQIDALKKLASNGGLVESYVAEPKTYSQVSERVSQKTKEAHVELYRDTVEALNRTSAELDTVDRGDVNSRHCAFRSLKLDETSNLNSVWLHELYFANCFDPHSEIYMDSMSYIRLQRDFGTFDDFQKDFVACGLAAGEGWVVCGYNTFLKKYVNTFVSAHSHDVMLGLYPVIVVDMWSHAEFKDYLNDKKSYLISQMREFNWNVIEERFKKSESIAEVLK